MNLYEVTALIESVKEDKELFNFYTKKREELIKEINAKAREALKKEIEFNKRANWRTPTDSELKFNLLETHLNRIEELN